MESLLTLPLAGEARVRILQITDTHLFAEKHETLLGVNTWDSYQSVLDAIHAESPEYDLIVATGDLAHDQSAAAYQHFAEGIASFRAPCVGYRVITISAGNVQRAAGCGHFPGQTRFHWRTVANIVAGQPGVRRSPR